LSLLVVFTFPFLHPQLQAPNPALCLLEQADYMECLHRNKLKRRIADKLVEAKRKQDGPAAQAHGGH
jgi:hypothetical protein